MVLTMFELFLLVEMLFYYVLICFYCFSMIFNAPKTMAVSSESVLRFMPGSSESVLERS